MIKNPSAMPDIHSTSDSAEKTEEISAAKDPPDKETQELRQLWRQLLTLQDEERRKIARELHDGTGQNMAALILGLTALRKAGNRLTPEESETLAECFSLASQVCDEIRTLAYVMHPPMLDEFGLVSALSLYIEGINKRHALKVAFERGRVVDRLPAEVELGLFRVAQAALTNVCLHSGSQKASVRLDQRGGYFIMEISDEGRGIPMRPDSGTPVGAGVGLTGMKERMALLNGTLEIQTGERGTIIRAGVPLETGKARLTNRANAGRS